MLRSSEFATFTPNNLGQFTAISQSLFQRNASGAWVAESVPHTAAYDALGRLTSFSAAGSSVEFKRSQTYAWDDNGNRTLQTFSEDGTLRSSSASVIDSASNRLLSLSGAPQALNAAGEHTQLGNLALAYDSAARLRQTTQSEPVVSGGGVRKPVMPFAPASHFYNGLNQRVLRENPQGQTVYVYGSDGHNVLGEYQPPSTSSIRWSNGLSTEHVWLPTASGPMPIATVINGEHFAVHADHLNTPRRLTDRNGNPRWQWAYSGFGEVAPQSLTTATLPEVRLNLRYPGQVDDANGLFYNWHRFYQPQTGRYTQVDPIGLKGGWNRFGYVGGNPLNYTDPTGEFLIPVVTGAVGAIAGGIGNYLVQKYYQNKCSVDWRDVLNAAAWGGAAGAALPFVGGGMVGAGAVGAAANLGQYGTSMAWSEGDPSWQNAAWSAGMGAFSGALGGAFTPVTWYGASQTAMPALARQNQTAATLGANSGFSNGARNGMAGVSGSLPPNPSAPQDCGCQE